MASKMQTPFIGEDCPICKMGFFELPANGQEWHLECSECGAIKFCYIPLPHQVRFHEDAAKFRGFFGGYGSSKTTTCVAEIIRHICETPNGTTLIGAQTVPQLEQTAEKTFFEMFPEQLIKTRSVQKKYVDTVNNHRILFRPLDDQGKIRSLNLTAFFIEEASEVDYDIFVQLQTRLRNHATEKHMGILSSNPEMNWLKTDFLLKSKNIHNAERDYYRPEDDINPNFSTHIAPTKLNTHLPSDYFETVAHGKPEWWVKRYLYGSFDHADGQVYPMYTDCIIPSFEIPKNWERYMALDPGLRHPTAVLWAAVDPNEGVLHLYKEHRESNKPIPYHAQIINAHNNTIPAGMLHQPIGDWAGKKRSDFDGRSTFDHYEEYGIYLKEASKALEAGIAKVYTFMALGKLKIHDQLTNLIKELANLKYKPQALGSDKPVDEKPIDKDDDLCDCMRYIVQELPDNPENLKNPSYSIYAKNGRIVEKSLPFALQDDNDRYSSGDWYYSAY